MTSSREESGDISFSCEWCGITVPDFKYTLSIGKWNYGRVFCSRSCNAAARLYSNILFTVVASALLIILAYTGYFMPYGDPSELARRQFSLFSMGIILIIIVSWVLLGIKVRYANSRSN